MSTVLRLAFGLLKLYIQLTNNIPAASLGLRFTRIISNLYISNNYSKNLSTNSS